MQHRRNNSKEITVTQETITSQAIETPEAHLAVATRASSLAELFATKRLANNSAPLVPAIEIVHYDGSQKRTSSNILPLSLFEAH
jgi:hypothetical protein